MSQEYTVSNAMPAKDKAGNVKFYDSPHGRLITWNLYFEGDSTKYQTNKKDGSEIKKGDVLYGHTETVERGGYKFDTFKSEQRPMGSLPAARPQSTPQLSNDIDEKLDYIISGIDDIKNRIGLKDIVPEGSDEPIDLSEIPF